MNNFEPINKIFDAVDELLNFNKMENASELEKTHLFISLIYVERFLDASRVLLPHGSAAENPQEMTKINDRLDELRGKIEALRGTLQSKSIEEGLDAAGEQFKMRFRQ